MNVQHTFGVSLRGRRGALRACSSRFSLGGAAGFVPCPQKTPGGSPPPDQFRLAKRRPPRSSAGARRSQQAGTTRDSAGHDGDQNAAHTAAAALLFCVEQERLEHGVRAVSRSRLPSARSAPRHATPAWADQAHEAIAVALRSPPDSSLSGWFGPARHQADRRTQPHSAGLGNPGPRPAGKHAAPGSVLKARPAHICRAPRTPAARLSGTG